MAGTSTFNAVAGAGRHLVHVVVALVSALHAVIGAAPQLKCVKFLLLLIMLQLLLIIERFER